MRPTTKVRAAVVAVAASLTLGGCGFSPFDIPLPGGADLGDEPYTVDVQFNDVLDLVPQSAVRVDDVAVGKVTDIALNGWTAVVTIEVNGDAELPDNAEASIRQTSLLGEKFVSLQPPEGGGEGRLSDGDMIPLERSGRNPEIEEVLGAASLLFNGGGLEKTNTIVRELNNALEGNEPEVKELIQTTSTFLGQLDDNKEALLTALEKVNRLAIATNDQEAAITGALDDLPEALTVINQQRDDLVGLLEGLDELSGVATGVIRESKDDVVADLRALVPSLTNLAAAGDDLAYSAKALLTFPFTDGFVGNSVANASGRCENTNRSTNSPSCFGDYANLSVNLDIKADQLENLLGFELLPSIDQLEAEGEAATEGGAEGEPAQELVQLIEGLVPDAGGLLDLDLPGQPTSTPSPSASPTPGAGSSSSGQQQPTPSSGLQLPGICSLLGQCRPAAASGPSTDLARLLVEPVVAP